MNKHWLSVVALAAALAWSAPIEAKQGRGHGKGKSEKHEAKAEKHEEKGEKHESKAAKHGNAARKAPRVIAPRVIAPAVVIDRDGHRRIVTEYYTRESLPPGLAKRQSLPPGLQRQLRERGRLPPGLQQRLVVVPAPLITQLPPVPPYYTRYFAGRDLVVVDTRTNTIVNIIRDVLARR